MQPQNVKIALLTSALFVFAAPGVRAEDGGLGGLASPGAGPADVGLQVYTGEAPHADRGLAIGPWLVYPSMFAGYVFNDNVFSTRNNRVALSGVQASPSLEAGMDNGLWRTNFSFGASTLIYPGTSGGQTRTNYFTGTSVRDAPPTNITGHVSVSESWLPLPDWSVVATGNFIRSQGLFGASSPTNGFGLGTPGVTAPAFTPSYIPSIGSLSSQQQYTNMYGGQFSVQKTINERTSLSSSIYAQGVSYDSSPSVSQLVGGVPVTVSNSAQPSGMSYGATVRGSFYATPQIYVFVQPGVSLQRFETYQYDSNGYQANVGAGSNLVGLFQGEIYGGWQSQSSVYGTFSTRSAPSFGASLRYFPTPLLTMSLNFSQSLGALQSTGFGSTPISPLANAGLGFTQQVYAAASYGLNSYMGLSVRAGWGQTSRSGGSNLLGSGSAGSGLGLSALGSPGASNTQIWSAGASLSYNFWRNTSVVLGYSFTKSSGGALSALLYPNANLLQLGYIQNLVTAGIRYSY